MTPEEMGNSMIDNLQEKTGKSLPEWLRITKDLSISRHGELVKYLKSEYSITHGYANLIAHKSLKSDAQSMAGEVDLIDAQYAGPKTELRPIYQKLYDLLRQFGSDVEFAPKKTYVSVRRKKQFAIIQPSTKTRVDVGINLQGVDALGRLEISGSFNAMVSHRVRLSNAEEVDDELGQWLKLAYEQAG